MGPPDAYVSTTVPDAFLCVVLGRAVSMETSGFVFLVILPRIILDIEVLPFKLDLVKNTKGLSA
jgi:hypothetical protein